MAEEEAALELSRRQLGKVASQQYTLRHPEARFLSPASGAPARTLQSSYSHYMVGSQFVPCGGGGGGGGTLAGGLVVSSGVQLAEAAEGADGSGWRRLSPREAARLQGFGEDWALHRERPYHLLGNAVAPPVVAMVAAGVLCRCGIVPPDGHHNAAEAGAAGAFAHIYMDRPAPAGWGWGWAVARCLLLDASPDDGRRAALRALLAAPESWGGGSGSKDGGHVGCMQGCGAGPAIAAIVAGLAVFLHLGRRGSIV